MNTTGMTASERIRAARTLELGDCVENIHPCNPRGIVGTVQNAPDDLGMVCVRTGPGSTIFGPAENWRRAAPAGLPRRIEHEDIRPGDVIELADEPAAVEHVTPWVGGTVSVGIRRPETASCPGAIGRYYLGSPVVLLERKGA